MLALSTVLRRLGRRGRWKMDTLKPRGSLGHLLSGILKTLAERQVVLMNHFVKLFFLKVDTRQEARE